MHIPKLMKFAAAFLSVAILLVSLVSVVMPASSYAAATCGKGKSAYTPSIELGCRSAGNPILDLTFAVVRFLSIGVGLVIVGSMIWAGIQYTTSRGDPNASAEAIKRIRANVFALLLFIFAYAILNYLIPGQLLK